MQQPSTPLGSAREISPRKKKGQISFAQSSFMSSIGDDDTINEKKVQHDIEYMYQALRKSKADNELLLARNRQLAVDLEEVITSFKEATLKAKLEQEAFVRTLRQEKNNADKRLVKATLKSQDRDNLLLDWVNIVVSNNIDEKYKSIADLTQRTGVMLPKAHKLAQYICQQQGRPLRTAKGGRRPLNSRQGPEEEEEEDEERVSTTPLLGERLIGGKGSKKNNNNKTDSKGGEGKKKEGAAAEFDEDLSVLQNFKKLEESVMDLASGYANYITADTPSGEKEEGSEVKQLFSGSEPHTYHSKTLPADEDRRTEAEQREKKAAKQEKEQREGGGAEEGPEKSPRSAASAGKPPKPTSSGAGGKKSSSSPLRGGGSRGKAQRPGAVSTAAAPASSSAPGSRKGGRRSAGGGSDSNQESDTDNEVRGGGSRGGLSSGGKKKRKGGKPKSRGSSAGGGGVDYDDLVNNEDDDESMYRLDRVVGEALFDFNILNMNLRGSCGTPQDAVARSLSGVEEDRGGGAAGGAAGASSRDGSSYSLYTSSKGKYGGTGEGLGSNNADLLQYSPDPVVPYKTPRNGVFNYDGVVDNIMSAVSEMNRSLTQDDDVRGAAAASPTAGGGGVSGKGANDKHWWDVTNKQSGENSSSGGGTKEGEKEEENDATEEDTATLLNTAINSARMAADSIVLAHDL